MAAAALALAGGAGGAARPAPADEWAGVPRVVAVGDVHGAYNEFVQILKESGLVDAQLKWTGGKAHLVQTGDVLDRGAEDKKVMDLLMALERQAEQAGGKVHALIGNHEAMNILGDLRYVAKEAYAAYATPGSEEVRERAYKDHVKYLNERAKRAGQPAVTPGEEFKKQWLAQRPLGYFEHRAAFDAGGKYGRWIGGHDAAIKINGIVFLHGGISEQLSAQSLGAINERVRQELGGFLRARDRLAKERVIEKHFTLDEVAGQAKNELERLNASGESPQTQTRQDLDLVLAVGGWYITHPTGPLWNREYANQPEADFDPALGRILSNLKARNLVVGHTPFVKGIGSRFSGKVWFIDTGMLRKYYQGRCSALVIEKDQLTPLYPTGGPCSP